MKDKPPVPLLVGMPLAPESLRKIGVLKHAPAAGSVPAPCDRCHQSTWLGLKQQAMKNTRPEIEFICANCLAADLVAAHAADPDVQVEVQSCHGNSGSFFMADGTVIPPQTPGQN
jgi:hypothetical protein